MESLVDFKALFLILNDDFDRRMLTVVKNMQNGYLNNLVASARGHDYKQRLAR